MKARSLRGDPPRIGVSWMELDQAATDLLVLAVKAAGGEPANSILSALERCPRWSASSTRS